MRSYNSFPNNNSTNMFQLLIGIAICVVLILSVGSVFFNASGSLQTVAQKNADEYATNMAPLSRAVCNKYDTDGNNYVTCTIFRRNNEPLEIECGLSGCRIPKKIVGVKTIE